MKKIFIILPALILAAACASNKTNVIGKPGIDYERYNTAENYEALPVTEAGVINDAGDDFTGESRFSARSAYGDAVITVGSKKFPLGRSAGQKEMRVFQSSMDKAYRNAKKTYNPAGFTYSMSPAGSINPLSDMEVQCILSQDSADNVGQQTCDLFFKSLRAEYADALENPNANL